MRFLFSVCLCLIFKGSLGNTDVNINKTDLAKK